MPCEHKRGMKVTHILFQSLALSCAIFGVWIAFNFKEHVRGLPEMASVHSWIGFGSIVFFAIQVRSST